MDRRDGNNPLRRRRQICIGDGRGRVRRGGSDAADSAGGYVPPPPVERAPGGSVLRASTPWGVQHRSTEHRAVGGNRTEPAHGMLALGPECPRPKQKLLQPHGAPWLCCRQSPPVPDARGGRGGWWRYSHKHWLDQRRPHCRAVTPQPTLQRHMLQTVVLGVFLR